MLIYGVDKVTYFTLEDIPSKTKFSVVIPFRNEVKNLPILLSSIKNLNYPKHLFEIILINDDSEDDSVKTIEKIIDTKTPHNDFSGIDIKIINNKRLTNSPKKDAITTAIKQSKYKWIISTDADCILPKYWLDSFDEYIQKTNAICIVAPVIYNVTGSFLNRFQLLDILSLQGATIGGFGIKKPFLCNGANFGYKKQLFNDLKGFDGNNNIASGDDIFLLEKATKTYPEKVHYLKSKKAVVKTESQPSWASLISQRVRWAAKTTAYNYIGKTMGIIVLLTNILILITLLLSILGLYNFKIWFYILIIKFSIDFYLIYKSTVFFNEQRILKSYFLGFFIYPFFSVYVALTSIFSIYAWKGRSFKK